MMEKPGRERRRGGEGEERKLLLSPRREDNCPPSSFPEKREREHFCGVIYCY